MENFLQNLKNAVDKGEFNSDAAKKINDIDKLADEKIKTAENSIEERLEKAGVKTVTEEEAAALNSNYEKQMEEIKKQDMVNKQLATLIEIEEMTKSTISDMMSFIDELEDKFTKEFDDEDPMYGELNQKIGQIKSKYNSIINN
jgi:hypothetical protein